MVYAFFELLRDGTYVLMNETNDHNGNVLYTEHNHLTKPYITMLELSDGVDQVSDDQFERLTADLNNLKTLLIENLAQVTQEGYASFFKNTGRTIREIYAKNNTFFTDKTVDAMTTYCCKLDQMTLCNQTGVTDCAIEFLMLRLGSSLKCLQIIKCPGISTSGIEALVSTCNTLRHLCLVGFPPLSVNTILAIASSKNMTLLLDHELPKEYECLFSEKSARPWNFCDLVYMYSNFECPPK